jgi:hypothetical protein
MGPGEGTCRHDRFRVRILCPQRRGRGDSILPLLINRPPIALINNGAYSFDQQWGLLGAPLAITVRMFASYVHGGGVAEVCCSDVSDWRSMAPVYGGSPPHVQSSSFSCSIPPNRPTEESRTRTRTVGGNHQLPQPGAVFKLARAVDTGARGGIISAATRRGHPLADIRTIHERVGHKDVKTTTIYAHVLNRGPAGIRSLCCGKWDRAFPSLGPQASCLWPQGLVQWWHRHLACGPTFRNRNYAARWMRFDVA